MAEEDKKKRGPLDKAAEVPDVVDVFTPAVTETKKGGLKIDRSKVTPVFDYGQVFTEDNIKTIEKQLKQVKLYQGIDSNVNEKI